MRTRTSLLVALTVLAWLSWAPAGQACESCKAAVAANATGLGEGINRSVLFMIAMVFAVPGALGFVTWNAYRRAANSGRSFAPAGKLRWEDRGPQSP